MLAQLEARLAGPIRERLLDGSIRLLRCSWLQSKKDADASSGVALLSRRQELPEAIEAPVSAMLSGEVAQDVRSYCSDADSESQEGQISDEDLPVPAHLHPAELTPEEIDAMCRKAAWLNTQHRRCVAEVEAQLVDQIRVADPTPDLARWTPAPVQSDIDGAA